jgi:surface antigen
MSRSFIFAALFAAALLGGCETAPPKPEVGMVTGPVVGSVLGQHVAGGTGKDAVTLGGAALGAFFGSRIGQSMDRDDQLKMAHALEVKPDDRPTTWRNPTSGHSYTVTPTRTYGCESNRCREFTATSQFDGREEVVHGTACRQPGGRWKTA